MPDSETIYWLFLAGREPRMMVVMSDVVEGLGEQFDVLPPLAAEDFVCALCRLDFSRVTIEQVLEAITMLPRTVREVVAAVPENALRLRPAPQLWSITEYVCHLRDVYATYTIRLHRAVTEDEPVLEAMFNDLRAQRFRYNRLDVPAVLQELDANAAGFTAEAATVPDRDWGRCVTRRPGESRTARWLARQVMHEGTHHLGDIRRTLAAVTCAT
ncbi:MAG: DinB family protein [Microbacteriaceae bacterium]